MREPGGSTVMGKVHGVRSGVRKLGIIALVLVLGMMLGGLAGFKFPGLNPFSTRSTNSNELVVKSIRLDQQVVLVSLGIQGIKSKTANSQVFGIDIPGSERALYLQYSYYAKLGINGKDVKIEKISDKRYRITIPKFVFLGHQDEKFQMAVEKNGLTSFVTPEMDTAQLITEVLNEPAKEQHVKDNKEILKSQAQAFYNGILRGIDPAITADYVFEDA